MKFTFSGPVPASKSILNRLLILKSFEPQLEIIGNSEADDVVHMKRALEQLEAGRAADCGAAGTTLRFLALRASRIPGRHVLTGTKRLFERPQTELVKVLKQLGCNAKLGEQSLSIEGQGWEFLPQNGLIIDRSVSSQFASAVLLSAWNLPQALTLSFAGQTVSEPYFKMTQKLVETAGLKLSTECPGRLIVTPYGKIKAGQVVAESDLSSAFALCALAALKGEAEITTWPLKSLQPDSVFPELLKRMGAEVEFSARSGDAFKNISRLSVQRPERVGGLSGIEVDLGEAPDLFPVLAVLCAFANGRSRLFGAPQLAFKESNRIRKVAELIRLAGREAVEKADGIEITGRAQRPGHEQRMEAGAHLDYDTDHDHRLAMAAVLVRAAGIPLRILNQDVVKKSFPEFFAIVRGGFSQRGIDQGYAH